MTIKNREEFYVTVTDVEEAERLARGISFDMSPEAIEQRLRICSAVSEMCITFKHAKIIGPVKRKQPPADEARPDEN